MGATVCVLVAWVYQGRAFAAFRAPSNAYFAHDPLARSAPSPRAPPTTLRPAGRAGAGCGVLYYRNAPGEGTTVVEKQQW